MDSQSGTWIYSNFVGPWLTGWFDKQQELENERDKKRVQKSVKATKADAKTQAQEAEKMNSAATLAERQRATGGKASAAAEVLESALTVKDMGDGTKRIENVDTEKLETFLSDEKNVQNMTAEEREAFNTALSSNKKSLESSLSKHAKGNTAVRFNDG